MSGISKKETKCISVRDLTINDKDRIRSLFKYGDASKIASRCDFVGYQQVLNVLNPKHPSDNESVWVQALNYLNSLSEVEIDERLARYIKSGEAA